MTPDPFFPKPVRGATQPQRVAIGQIDSVCNDLEANLRVIEEQAHEAARQNAQMILFPELALSGYLVDDRFSQAAILLNSEPMKRLCQLSKTIDLAVGFIEETPSALFYNSTAYLSQGEVRHVHRKVYLPTYGRFDERRYFGAGWNVAAFDTQLARVAMLICGDAWHLPLPYMAAHDGTDVLYIQAASSVQGLADTTPAQEAWQWMCRSYALTLSCFVVFANLSGKTEGLDFWGGSFVVGPDGMFIAQSPTNERDVLIADLDFTALRKQRIMLPFRRDDSLAHTVALGQRVLDRKIQQDTIIIQQSPDQPVAPKPR